jgi:hypothetical protein
VVAQPRGGGSFDIGRLTPEARARVPLREVKPVFLECSFQDERRMRDTLGLEKAVEDALRAEASRGRSSALVFVEAREMPGAYEIVGRYRARDGAVTVSLRVFRGEEETATFCVDGRVADVAKMAAEIVRQALDRIPE